METAKDIVKRVVEQRDHALCILKSLSQWSALSTTNAEVDKLIQLTHYLLTHAHTAEGGLQVQSMDQADLKQLIQAAEQQGASLAVEILEQAQRSSAFMRDSKDNQIEYMIAQVLYAWVFRVLAPEPKGALTELQQKFFGPPGRVVWRWILNHLAPSTLVPLVTALEKRLPYPAWNVLFGAPSLLLLPVPSTVSELLHHCPSLATWLMEQPLHLATLLMHAVRLDDILLVDELWRTAMPRQIEVLHHIQGSEKEAVAEWWHYAFHPCHRGYILPMVLFGLFKDASIRQWVLDADESLFTAAGAINQLLIDDEFHRSLLVQTLTHIRDLHANVLHNDKKDSQGIETTLQRVLDLVQESRVQVTLPLTVDVVEYDPTQRRLVAVGSVSATVATGSTPSGTTTVTTGSTPTSSFWATLVQRQDGTRYMRALYRARYDPALVPGAHRSLLEAEGKEAYLKAIVEIDEHAKNVSDEEEPDEDDPRTWPHRPGTLGAEPSSSTSLVALATKAAHRAARYHGKVLYKGPKFQKTLHKGLEGKERSGPHGPKIQSPHNIHDPLKRKKAMAQILAIAYSQQRQSWNKHGKH